MSYPVGNAPFVHYGNYQEDADADYDDNNAYETDDKETPGRKPTRRSTKGRKLKRWDADEDQKLLLYIDYVCAEQAITLPWNDIASTMEPRDPSIGEKPMTGEAIKQHLAKLRDHRISVGYNVPPKLDRNARRQALAGKIPLQSPAPTPRKFIGSGGQGKGKTEVEGLVKKESTLLAPISKAKQKKAEQAKKAAEVGIDGSKGPAAGGPGVGGVKVTGKRGRRPAIKKDEDEDNGAAAGVASAKQLRQHQRKNYSGMSLDTEDSNVKNEPESDNDLPLFKRRNVSRKSGVSKPAELGLLDDTIQRWDNRDANTTASKTTAQSAGVERPTEQFITVPNDSDHEEQNDHDLPKVPQTAPCTMSTGFGFPFHRDMNYQGPVPFGGADEQGLTFRNSWPQQLYSGQPSPMDNTFMAPPTSVYPGPSQALNLPYGNDAVVPQTPYTPSAYGNTNQQVGNEVVGPQTPFTSMALGSMNQQTPNFGEFTSSPTFGSFSSHTLPGNTFDQSFDPALSGAASKNTSFNSSLVSANDLQDPFIGGNIDGAFGGLPAAMSNTTPSNWGAATATYGPAAVAGLASIDADYHHTADIGGQGLSEYAEPGMPADGLGISIPQASGDVFPPATMSSADNLHVKNELALSRPLTPAMASGFDISNPQDPFGDFIHGLNGPANMFHTTDNNIFG